MNTKHTPGPLIGSDAYKQGKAAYNAGKERSDNPFKFPAPEHTAWLMGFNWEREPFSGKTLDDMAARCAEQAQAARAAITKAIGSAS